MAHPEQLVVAGHTILEVNGSRSVRDMPNYLASPMGVELLISPKRRDLQKPLEAMSYESDVRLQRLARLGIFLLAGPCRQVYL